MIRHPDDTTRKAVLNVFAGLVTPALPATIQLVKQSLYRRDYAAAFDSPDKLQAYAARWSVARALAYLDMISDGSWSPDVARAFARPGPLNVACIGGLQDPETYPQTAPSAGLDTATATPSAGLETIATATPPETVSNSLDLTLLDFAAWAPIVDSLYAALTDPARSPQLRLSSSSLAVRCRQQDVLAPLSGATVSSLAEADIITVLFTAGELYSQSPTATTKLFLSLHAVTKPGALLVIVDSAGGFEDLDVPTRGSPRKPATASDKDTSSRKPATTSDKDAGRREKTGGVGGYKLGFLLDKTLTSKERWQQVASDDSKWWRASAYPLDLENMRCLIRVYRRNNDD
ncbi:hypothetical protein DRE_07454 [Drechslerella stenobrocha 248]|uniref:Uncharacterized protein n=1 Tax=Drechslerella stenobrocha 248 TaxID=1043628 RepID=W7HUG0_9PEZI|nr:hypothetical protein DRE_07454 [Drechslerella stenobrocha 248]